MRNGDCSVTVYRACNTTAATPVVAAERRSSPRSLTGIPCDFGRLPRVRFGTVAVRDIGGRLWIVGTLRQKRFAVIVESIEKEEDVAEAFFD